MQFWEKNMNCHEIVYIFLAFSFIFIQNMELKEKKHWNFFFIQMACITFYVTWKRDFLENVAKTNKKVYIG